MWNRKNIIQMNVDEKKARKKVIFWNVRNVILLPLHTELLGDQSSISICLSLSPTFVRPLVLTGHHIHTSFFFYCKEHNHMHTYLSIYMTIYILSK